MSTRTLLMSFMSLMMATRAAIVALAMVASLLSRPFLVLWRPDRS
ncbi:hypothetical protein [Abiotrophia defectiva]|nr:hypothetical protein [Abiotrophia defectiva]